MSSSTKLLAMLILILHPSGVLLYETLDAFLTVFPGQYDNEAQLLCTGGVTSEGKLVTRSNFAFLQVEVPALLQGDAYAQVYVEQYTNNDPALVYRRRIYQFTDYDNGTLVTEIYRFNDEFKFRNVLSYPALLLSMTLDEISYIQGCDVMWQRSDTFLFNGFPSDQCFTSDGEERIEEYVTSSQDYFYLDYIFRNASNDEINLHLDLNLTRINPKPTLDSYDSIKTSLENGDVLHATFSPERACGFSQNGQTIGGEITDWRVYEVFMNIRLQFVINTGVTGDVTKYIFTLDEFDTLRVFRVLQDNTNGEECILYGDTSSTITSYLTISKSYPGQTISVGTSYILKSYLDGGYPLLYLIDLGQCSRSSGPTLPQQAQIGGVLNSYTVEQYEDVSFYATFPSIVGASSVTSADYIFKVDHFVSEVIVDVTDDINVSLVRCGIRGAANSDGQAMFYIRENKQNLNCKNFS